MVSKVQHATNYWTDDTKMTSKGWGWGCVIFGEQKNKERNGETPLRMGGYFEWIMKQLLNSAFVGHEEFCRSRGVLQTLPDLQNSLCRTQAPAIIAKYAPSRALRAGWNILISCRPYMRAFIMERTSNCSLTLTQHVHCCISHLSFSLIFCSHKACVNGSNINLSRSR